MTLRDLAERRERLHADHASSRPLSNDYELVGLAGEQAFGRETGLSLDREDRPGGDKGIDFVVVKGAQRVTFDVKTARKAYNLIVEQGKVWADVYVLAQYNDQTEQAVLLGYLPADLVRAAPVKDFGYGIENHYVPRAGLRPMERLIDWVRDA